MRWQWCVDRQSVRRRWCPRWCGRRWRPPWTILTVDPCAAVAAIVRLFNLSAYSLNSYNSCRTPNFRSRQAGQVEVNVVVAAAAAAACSSRARQTPFSSYFFQLGPISTRMFVFVGSPVGLVLSLFRLRFSPICPALFSWSPGHPALTLRYGRFAAMVLRQPATSNRIANEGPLRRSGVPIRCFNRPRAFRRSLSLARHF